MKFDMHCHTKEGSLDGKVPVEEFIASLERKGYDGMLISDHDTYNGYREWLKNLKGRKFQDFVVLKGIEYDTIDAGHMLVILPETTKLKILELRGLPVRLLIDIVHKNGGILGPAHPCGEKYLSITNTRKHRHQLAVMDKFDFIEGFNACEESESNEKAMEIAREFGKPVFGGSDAHKSDCIGLGWTQFCEQISCESDLIRLLREKGSEASVCGGQYYAGTTKKRIGRANNLLVECFWFYNHAASIRRYRKRRLELKNLNVLVK